MSSHYEVLRAYVTEGFAGSIPRGLTLFMRSGLAAWLKECSSLPTASNVSAHRPDPTTVPIAPAVGLASLLADMAMRPARWRHAI